MKKILLLTFILTLTLFLLVSCNAPSESSETEGTTCACTTTQPPAETTGPNYDGLSEEDIAIRRVADAALIEEYGVKDFSKYEIRIIKYDNGTVGVRYELLIHGFYTSARLYVGLEADKTVSEVSGGHGKFAPFLDTVTKEEVDAAIAKIKAQAGKHFEDAYIEMYVDLNGDLRFYGEVIIDIVSTETWEDGTPASGCGYDHKHLYYDELICKKPS